MLIAAIDDMLPIISLDITLLLARLRLFRYYFILSFHDFRHYFMLI